MATIAHSDGAGAKTRPTSVRPGGKFTPAQRAYMELAWLLEQVTERGRQDAKDAFERGRQQGFHEGYERADRDQAASWAPLAREIRKVRPPFDELERRRWGDKGWRHFGDSREGEYAGGPAGPSCGQVWLAGPAVHHHACTKACRAYEPGWYEPERAAEILAALP